MNTTLDTSYSIEDAKQDVKESLDSITDYSKEKKTKFEKMVQEKIKDLDREMDHLGQECRKLGEESRTKMSRHLAKLQTEREMLEARLKSMGTQTDNAWIELKGGIQKAWNELNDSFGSAIDQYNQEKSADRG